MGVLTNRLLLYNATRPISWRCCYFCLLRHILLVSYEISSILFRHITSFLEYQSESTFYRDSMSLQCIQICNSMQAKSDVNSISLEEIRRKPVLCSEQAGTQFLFPFQNKMRLPEKSLSLTALLSHAHTHTFKHTYGMHAGSCLKIK